MNALPFELRFKIATYLEPLDVLALSSVTRDWRLFTHNFAHRLPKLEVTNLRVEQWNKHQYEYKLHCNLYRPCKAAKLKVCVFVQYLFFCYLLNLDCRIYTLKRMKACGYFFK